MDFISKDNIEALLYKEKLLSYLYNNQTNTESETDMRDKLKIYDEMKKLFLIFQNVDIVHSYSHFIKAITNALNIVYIYNIDLIQNAPEKREQITLSYKQYKITNSICKEVLKKDESSSESESESESESSSESEPQQKPQQKLQSQPQPQFQPPINKVKLTFIKGKVITSKANNKMNIISTIFQNTMDSSEDLSSSNNNNIPLQNTSEYDLSLLQKQMYFILLLYCRDSLKTLLEENKSNNTFITPYTEYVKSIKEMIKNTPEEIDYSTTLNDICDYTVEVKMYISDLQMLQYIYIYFYIFSFQ